MTRNDKRAGDMAVAGNLTIADGALMRANLRCEGHARLGEGATIEGDIEVAGTVAVREGARVTGLLSCRSTVDWQRSASAAALRCDGALRVDGAQVAAAVEATEGIGPLVEVRA